MEKLTIILTALTVILLVAYRYEIRNLIRKKFYDERYPLFIKVMFTFDPRNFSVDNEHAISEWKDAVKDFLKDGFVSKKTKKRIEEIKHKIWMRKSLSEIWG